MSSQTSPDLIPVAHAAVALGLKRQTLDDRLRARGIVPVRLVVSGRVRVFLTAEQLVAARLDMESEAVLPAVTPDLIGGRDQVDPHQGASGPIRPASGPDQVAIRSHQVADQVARPDEPAGPDPDPDRAMLAHLHELELTIARLRGSLEMSDRVEQSAQRVADRLEKQLEALQGQLVEVQERARREVVSLAREIGMRDSTIEDLRSKVELLADIGPDPDDERRRWWAGFGWFRARQR